MAAAWLAQCQSYLRAYGRFCHLESHIWV